MPSLLPTPAERNPRRYAVAWPQHLWWQMIICCARSAPAGNMGAPGRDMALRPRGNRARPTCPPLFTAHGHVPQPPQEARTLRNYLATEATRVDSGRNPSSWSLTSSRLGARPPRAHFGTSASEIRGPLTIAMMAAMAEESEGSLRWSAPSHIAQRQGSAQAMRILEWLVVKDNWLRNRHALEFRPGDKDGDINVEDIKTGFLLSSTDRRVEEATQHAAHVQLHFKSSDPPNGKTHLFY